MLRYRITALLLVGLLLPALIWADDKAPSAPAGSWKVILPAAAGNNALWLVSIEKKGENWDAEIVGTAPGTLKGSVHDFKVSKSTASFTLKAGDLPLTFEFKISDKNDRMNGVALMRRQPTPAILERTTLKSLDPFEVAQDDLARKELGHETLDLAMGLIGQAGAKKATAAQVRRWGERAIEAAELYGDTLKFETLLRLASVTGRQEGLEATALQYARKAEQMLAPKAAPAEQKRVLDILATALERAGRDEEAKSVQARVKKLDFRVKPVPFAGRKGKSDRVVLVELFTNTEAEDSLAADMAFAALEKSYKPSEVVLLRYHVHAPLPDPLATGETEARMAFYERLRRPPAPVFNGKPAALGGGEAPEAQDKYEEYLGIINPLLETDSQGKLDLSATQAGDVITITCNVKGLPRSGDDIRLRVALTEAEVKFKGGSGQEIHTQVVRLMPGGEAGTILKDKDGKAEFKVNLADLKKARAKYLEDYNSKRPFPAKERPLELKNLRVVAFVQDDNTDEVFQAAQVTVLNSTPKDKPKE